MRDVAAGRAEAAELIDTRFAPVVVAAIKDVTVEVVAVLVDNAVDVVVVGNGELASGVVVVLDVDDAAAIAVAFDVTACRSSSSVKCCDDALRRFRIGVTTCCITSTSTPPSSSSNSLIGTVLIANRSRSIYDHVRFLF